jgi:hypothetical protein
MTPLHYAKAIATGLYMAKKAKQEGAYRAACMLDAIARGDLSSARSHWLMVDLWVSQVNSINRMTLDMCKASRMPMYGGETTLGTEANPSVLTSGGRSEAATLTTGNGVPSHSVQPLPAGPQTDAGTSPSYFPPVLRP